MAEKKNIWPVVLGVVAAGGLAYALSRKGGITGTPTTGTEQPPATTEGPTLPPQPSFPAPPSPPTTVPMAERVLRFVGYLDLYCRTGDRKYRDEASIWLPRIYAPEEGKAPKSSVLTEELVDKLLNRYNVWMDYWVRGDNEQVLRLHVNDNHEKYTKTLPWDFAKALYQLMGCKLEGKSHRILKYGAQYFRFPYNTWQGDPPLSEFAITLWSLADALADLRCPVEWVLLPAPKFFYNDQFVTCRTEKRLVYSTGGKYVEDFPIGIYQRIPVELLKQWVSFNYAVRGFGECRKIYDMYSRPHFYVMNASLIPIKLPAWAPQAFPGYEDKTALRNWLAGVLASYGIFEPLEVV